MAENTFKTILDYWQMALWPFAIVKHPNEKFRMHVGYRVKSP
jgi:hypothetical protein